MYAHLKAAGAVFGEKLGWERPNWFAVPGEEERYSYLRPGWFDAVAREHLAAREGVVVIDQTSFAKFRLKGPDACAALSWIAAGRVDRPVGTLTYTQMLNEKGGIEADVTVARIADDEFYITTGTGFATHDFDWINRNLCGDCALSDVTSGSAVLSLMGPSAREVLAGLCPDDLTGAGFPFGTARWISVARCPVLALRVTYVGELGWELHVPVEYAVTVYEALIGLGVVNAGYRAIETLRLEKGYRAWGSDIGPDHTPVEAGLLWACKMKSGQPFLGRQALEAQVAGGARKRLATFVVDDPAVILLGRETIYRDGVRVGWLSSGGFGHTVGRPIGMGYVRVPGVDADYLATGVWELEVASERVPARAMFDALYDPKGERVKL